jgi:hypothetical protein
LRINDFSPLALLFSDLVINAFGCLPLLILIGQGRTFG